MCRGGRRWDSRGVAKGVEGSERKLLRLVRDRGARSCCTAGKQILIYNKEVVEIFPEAYSGKGKGVLSAISEEKI